MAYLTTPEFRSYRDIEGESDDAVIDTLIMAAQKAVDNYCHRRFEGSAANRTFDAPFERTIFFDEDLASIVTITNGNGSTVASTEYVTKPRNAVVRGLPIYAIELKSQSAVYWRSNNGDYQNAITINGVWAYSATPPQDVKLAMKMLVSFYYDSRQSVGSDVVVVPGVSVKIPQGMPASVRQLLEPYRRVEL